MSLSLDLTAAGAREALRPAPAPEKPSLIGLAREEMAQALVATGLVPEKQARMRVQQLWH